VYPTLCVPLRYVIACGAMSVRGSQLYLLALCLTHPCSGLDGTVLARKGRQVTSRIVLQPPRSTPSQRIRTDPVWSLGFPVRAGDSFEGGRVPHPAPELALIRSTRDPEELLGISDLYHHRLRPWLQPPSSPQATEILSYAPAKSPIQNTISASTSSYSLLPLPSSKIC